MPDAVVPGSCRSRHGGAHDDRKSLSRHPYTKAEVGVVNPGARVDKRGSS